VHDRTGSYTFAFLLFMALYALAAAYALIAASLRPPTPSNAIQPVVEKV
jgi:hypothetical protein